MAEGAVQHVLLRGHPRLAIKRGYIAADLFSVVLGSLVYLWPLFWPHRRATNYLQIEGEAESVGSVQSPDEKSAILKAIREFHITGAMSLRRSRTFERDQNARA